MKLINYKSPWIWGLLWINHTVLVSDGYVLSYMLNNKFEAIKCWKWKYYLYNEKDWAEYDKKITFELDLPDMDLKPYKWIKREWIYCYEALLEVCNDKNIDIMETVKNRTWNIIKWIMILLVYTAFVWFLGFTANDSIENMFYDVHYIDNLEQICQEWNE